MSLSQQLRKIIFSPLYYTGIPFLLRGVVARNKTTIVVFHAPSPDAARGHLEALRKRYNIIPLADYLRARIAEREIERRRPTWSDFTASKSRHSPFRTGIAPSTISS